LLRFDHFGHGVGKQVPDRAPGLNAGPDFGRGKFQRKTSEKMKSKSGGRRDGFNARSGNDHELNQIGEALGVSPRRKRSDVVGADEPAQGGSGKSPGIVRRRLHTVGNASATDFLFVDLDLIHSREREAQHPQTEV